MAVRVVVRAKQNSVELQPDGSLRVRVTAAPTDGKANDAVIKILAKYFGRPKTSVRLISGATTRTKIFDV
ncbi:MAG: hypothetical protein A3C15_03065 [Candidatus Magasanikbacteria bacterium RIFCSPHIGHO2_02_FULL_50_9b]|uniref:Uncharacterized protein n=1 Tax=Candidatus Magasanikbacteria bacterium RIFCSPHIGHO2_02_FULL_50_9b TaxID=1798682 RepID=A0A1F6M912_9BACT|nr:MAG: hypothetical protein A3C15_03065 [Candidatus Magasanikbacteria bacterium RIFCSPHIGHO2_02_FULL_50_9b]